MKPVVLARRAARHLAWRVERACTLTVESLRRGDRTVITTPTAGIGFGNWLYLWLEAHRRTEAGQVTQVLEASGMDTWLRAFPGLARLTIPRGTLRFHDARMGYASMLSPRFGVDFSRDSLNEFIQDALAPRIAPGPSDSLVVNVRRGDYYSDPYFRRLYGFDQIGYLRAALETVGRVDRARVVSDDIDWCRRNIQVLLLDYADAVEFVDSDPLGDFQIVAGAASLIGTNSTFSYWGGYVAGVLNPSARAVMPQFHARLPEMEIGPQLDPRWTVIEGFH